MLKGELDQDPQITLKQIGKKKKACWMYEGLEQHVMKEIHKTLDERCMDTSCTNLSDFPAKFFTINPLRIIQARLHKQNFKSPAMLTDSKK